MLNADLITRFAGAWGERQQTFVALRRIARTRLTRPRPLPPALQRAWYTILQRRGIMVVPGFWSRAECARARAELERLEVAYPQNVHRRSDRRLFGVDRASPLLRAFAEHPDLVALSQAFYGTERGSCVTLGAHLPFTEGNLGSGEGWHRDSLAPQFKAILYLTDVSIDNGPFELIPGSHRPLRMARDIVLARLGARTRLSDAEVEEVTRRYPEGVATVTGAQGTLVLANSSAIHRGRPIAGGERVALTNYYYPTHPLPRRYEELFAPILPYVSE